MTADVLFPTSADEAASLFGDGDGHHRLRRRHDPAARDRGRPAQARARADAPPGGLDTLRRRRPRRRSARWCRSTTLVELARRACSPTSPRTSPTARCGATRRSAATSARLPARDAQRGDLGGPLIALGARVRSTGAGGERTEPIEDFLAGDRTGRLVLDGRVRPRRAPLRRRPACAAGTRTRTRSPAPSPCSRADGSDLRVARQPASARRPSAAAPSSRAAMPEDVLKDVEPVDDAVASAALPRRRSSRSSSAKPSTNWRRA